MESLDLREHQSILSADRAASGKDVEVHHFWGSTLRSPPSRVSSRAPAYFAGDHRRVDAAVEGEHENPQHHLDSAREPIGIDHPHDIVRDEATGIGRVAGSMA